MGPRLALLLLLLVLLLLLLSRFRRRIRGLILSLPFTAGASGVIKLDC